jgi:hypothetical protein
MARRVGVGGKQHSDGGLVDSSDKFMLGSGGTRYKITWLDGRESITNNLWIQGTPPSGIASQFPHNATLEALR